MKPASKITFYIIYGLLALVFFAYYLFPQQTVLQMITKAAARVDPQIELKAAQVKPKLPPGLNFKKVQFNYAGVPVLLAERVKITPAFTSLFEDEKEIGFIVTLGDGTIKGLMNLDRKINNRPAKLVATGSGISLSRIAYFKQWPQVKIDGKINGRLDYDGRKGVSGRAHLEILASNVAVGLQLPLVPFDKLAFSRIHAQLNLDGRRLAIKRCQLDGEQLSGKVSGFMILLRPRQRSRLNLSCTLKPEAGLSPAAAMSLKLLSGKSEGSPITIRINGTLERPKYTIR